MLGMSYLRASGQAAFKAHHHNLQLDDVAPGLLLRLGRYRRNLKRILYAHQTLVRLEKGLDSTLFQLQQGADQPIPFMTVVVITEGHHEEVHSIRPAARAVGSDASPGLPEGHPSSRWDWLPP